MGKGFVVALVFGLTFSAIGEEPLPTVIAKAPLQQITTRITTEVEPVHETAPLTIADAARGNDFAAFNTLYTARPNPAFADLHELWSYSQTERFGAFYGEELHARFAQRYPGYAEYIEEYRIVDSHGTVFWPSAETRTFLLQHAGEAIGNQRPAIRRVAQHTAKPAKRRTGSPTDPGRLESRPYVAPREEPQPPKIVMAAPPPLIADRQSLIAPPQTADNAATGRGIFLMILGLVGVGVLTLMLRTPPEEEAEKRNVITTLKLTSLPPEAEQEPRKTGSHG